MYLTNVMLSQEKLARLLECPKYNKTMYSQSVLLTVGYTQSVSTQ